MSRSPDDIPGLIQEAITQNIEKYGLHVQYVFASEDTPSFIYTIGMTDIGAPELLVFSLPPQDLYEAISQLYHEMRMGQRPKDSDRITDLWSVPMILESVDREDAAQYTLQAEAYYRGKGVKPVYKQMVWPDTHGKYPHQYGFDKTLRASQPYLGKRHPRLDDDCGVEYFSHH
ncbi:DUF4262 domain-containing protein (plasmid) [Pseudomonas sp. Leaf58]|uniref:DUF4262 domain-containing protein n=1 Tax=Pseudomonas sp. Leaf58 TaxID=1736226 RepID=UPI0006F241C6|nr:DUF4262 domain-containing protein [Pseudomonas sp. Leaf58]AYG47773.1 DUF4262 domain-containing protein [Pseudomonas sp. Leaf58]KQN62662.1 hypothetical protein ASF02_10975 [Pseudomonas sp. Leaf58]